MQLKLYRGKWVAYWRDGSGPRRVSLRTSDRAEAVRRLADLTRQPLSTGATIDAIMAAYLADKADKASAPQMQNCWNMAEFYFAALRPDQVTRDSCKIYIRARSRKVGNATISKELRTIRAALRWHDRATPAQFFMPPPSPPKDRALTRDEARLLIDSAASPHIRLFIILALATAGRAQALLDLTWDRVDFARRQVRLATENMEGRKGRATVPVTQLAHQALEQAQRAALTNHVIEYNGAPVASIKSGFRAAARRANLAAVTPHVLRHTAAVWMAESGTPIEEIAQFLGHSDARITYRVYARYSPNHLRSAARALEL
jgi:integrase